MERAKEFDSSNQFNEPLEGVLLKWVNLMKGYQPRYFVLDPVQCSLYYYMVNSSNGITYKLKASNSKERQKWISHLRVLATRASRGLGQTTPITVPPVTPTTVTTPISDSPPNKSPRRPSVSRKLSSSFLVPSTKSTPIHKSKSVSSELEVEPILPMDPIIGEYLKATSHFENLVQLLEDKEFTHSINPDVLLLKATSQSTIQAMQDCLALIQTEK